MLSKQLSFLQSVDSPTVANAIERLHPRDRCDGYLPGWIRCQFPDLGVMVGHALTVTMDSPRGAVASREGHWRLWEALEKTPSPSIVVVKDVSGTTGQFACFGEVMASVAKACGAAGIVCDGGVRDLAEVHALGVHYFAPYPVVSHGNFRIVEVGVPVELGGQTVSPGDLLHGDANGVVIVPKETLSQIEETVSQIRARERRILDYVRAPGFSLDGLRDVGTY